ncbi:WD40-repeat-containing domain protein [Flammula alnicola]|nr:WD40-repeat-containing domain protein [Flammula alnicola]
MSSPTGVSTNDCIFETPLASRPRKRVHESVTNLRSHKRRRVSMPSLDLGRGLDVDNSAENSRRIGATADRFISNRPKLSLPLNITPRTNRISKQFGLVDDRVLNFRDTNQNFNPSYNDNSTMALLRRSASSLFYTPPLIRSSSVTENLNKRRQCLMVLDSPGVPVDQEAFPITWSRRNLIAVACKNNIYYQNLDTKTVSHLCTSPFPGQLGVILWGEEQRDNYLAMGMSTGHLQVWDAGSKGGAGTPVHTWTATKDPGVKSLSWNEDVLAVGMEDGEISLIDLRTPRVATRIAQHRSHVLGLEWSADKSYLASGDSLGVVHIWDRRVGKSLLDTGEPMTKIRHQGSARAMAWCPWKPDLLATGSMAPEGKIKIWSSSSVAPHSPSPIQTIPLNTSVLSLHWSPHCKELLSTHGASFMPLPTPRHRTGSTTTTTNTRKADQKLTYTQTPLTNSITVHEYPSCKRLMTLTNAHTSAVTQSCLSPSGESIFTVCPREETIKMWQVWSRHPPAAKRESAFDKFTIR